MGKAAESDDRLEVNEDRAWQERTWTIQRLGWIAMVVFLLAALFGATGSGGPLATARVATGGGTIDHPRIARWQSAEQVTVNLPSGSTGPIDVELERSFVDLFSIESVEPDPSQVTATGAGHRFTFDLAGDAGPKSIAFHVRASNPAIERAIGVRIGEGRPARMIVTVLP